MKCIEARLKKSAEKRVHSIAMITPPQQLNRLRTDLELTIIYSDCTMKVSL